MTTQEMLRELEEFEKFKKDLRETRSRIVEYDHRPEVLGKEIYGLHLYCKMSQEHRFRRESFFHYEIRSIFGVVEVLKFIKRWQGICLNSDSTYEFRLNGKKYPVEF